MSQITIPASPGTDRRPHVEIDSWALKSNWRSLAMQNERTRTGAAVKAGGYGLGAVIVSKALFGAGCRDFFVAWASEGAEIREAMPGKNCRIFVLQGLDEEAAALCRKYRLIPVLSTPEDIALWQSTGGGELPGVSALQIETGMNRLGLDEAEAKKAAALARNGSLDLALVMSHLASADDAASQQRSEQLKRFLRLTGLFPHIARSLANSAGVFRGSDYHFALTRPGIALYGGEIALDPTGAIRPVATLIGHVMQVRTAKKGEAAGYGATAKLRRPTRIATIGIGYADGYLRSASGISGQRASDPAPDVFIGGQRAPVLGRVSMDMTLVDVTDLPETAVKPGDKVEFFGANIPIDEVAKRCGTISYELLTGLGPRVARRWV